MLFSLLLLESEHLRIAGGCVVAVVRRLGVLTLRYSRLSDQSVEHQEVSSHLP